MTSAVCQFHTMRPGPCTQKNMPTTSSTIWMNELPRSNGIGATSSGSAASGCRAFVLIVRR